MVTMTQMDGDSRMISAAVVFLFLILMAGNLHAEQENPRRASTGGVKLGMELDALPYLSGGYYGSLWLGQDAWRLRGVVAKTSIPQTFTPDGFEDYSLMVGAVIVDYFLGTHAEENRGPWIGSGFEYWRSSVENEHTGDSRSFDNTVFTLGGGYVWKLTEHLYLNPWVAGHLIIAGDTTKQIGDDEFKAKRFTPEASIKLGWIF